MKILYTSLLFLMNCVLSVAQPEIIVPKPHQLKWHEAEMGAVFHYGELHLIWRMEYLSRLQNMQIMVHNNAKFLIS